MSSSLEPKFGWGHEEALRNYKEALAVQIEQLEIAPEWRPDEVLRYVAKLVRNTQISSLYKLIFSGKK